MEDPTSRIPGNLRRMRSSGDGLSPPEQAQIHSARLGHPAATAPVGPEDRPPRVAARQRFFDERDLPADGFAAGLRGLVPPNRPHFFFGWSFFVPFDSSRSSKLSTAAAR